MAVGSRASGSPSGLLLDNCPLVLDVVESGLEAVSEFQVLLYTSELGLALELDTFPSSSSSLPGGRECPADLGFVCSSCDRVAGRVSSGHAVIEPVSLLVLTSLVFVDDVLLLLDVSYSENLVFLFFLVRRIFSQFGLMCFRVFVGFGLSLSNLNIVGYGVARRCSSSGLLVGDYWLLLLFLIFLNECFQSFFSCHVYLD